MDTATVTPVKQASSDLHASIEQVQSQLVEFDKISAGLAALEQAHPKDVACAVSTVAGMKQAIAGRAAWRDPRVALEKVRKAAKAPVLALGRDIDSFARSLETKLLEGETHYDEQIKAEEARKEAERQERLRKEAERVARIRDLIMDNFTSVPAAMVESTAAGIGEEIVRVVALEITPTAYQELTQEAQESKDKALHALRVMQEKAADRELEAARLKAEREELARQRAERDAENARLEKERKALAAQRAAAEAEHQQAMEEARARRQREEDEIRAAREEQDRADRARRDEEDRQARQARAAEDQRLARERAAIEEERRIEREAQERRVAEARRVEQERLDKEAADRRAAEEEEIAQRRRQEEEERVIHIRVFEAAPLMLEALQQWKNAEDAKLPGLLKVARITRDKLLESLQ